MDQWIFLGSNGGEWGSSVNVFWYNPVMCRLLVASTSDSFDPVNEELFGGTPPIDIDHLEYITDDQQIPVSAMIDVLCDLRVDMHNVDTAYDINARVYPEEYQVDNNSAQGLSWRVIGSVDGIVYIDETYHQYIVHNAPRAYGYSYANPKPSIDCNVYKLSSSLESNDARAFTECSGILKSLGVRMGDY